MMNTKIERVNPEQIDETIMEEAGRLIRYQALEETGRNWEKETKRPVKIAVAHHSRDQAETILLNLFRGSGLGGLKGIPYVRDHCAVRRGRLCLPFKSACRYERGIWIKA